MRIRNLLAVVAVPLLVVTSSLPALAHAQALTTEEARAVIAPFYKSLNVGNDAIALLYEATSSDWTSCGGNDSCRPRDQAAPAIAGLHKTIPDLKWEVKEVLVAGDHVIVRGEASGTPVAPFLGVPSGGKSFRVMSIDIHTIKNGKITKTHHIEDWLGAVRQLSVQ